MAMTPAIIAPVTSRPGAAPLVRDAEGADVVPVGELADKLRRVEEAPLVGAEEEPEEEAKEDWFVTGVELGVEGVVADGVMMAYELTMGVGIGIDDVDDGSVDADVVRAPTTVMVAVFAAWAACANNGAQTAQSRRRNILPGKFMVIYI